MSKNSYLMSNYLSQRSICQLGSDHNIYPSDICKCHRCKRLGIENNPRSYYMLLLRSGKALPELQGILKFLSNLNTRQHTRIGVCKKVNDFHVAIWAHPAVGALTELPFGSIDAFAITTASIIASNASSPADHRKIDARRKGRIHEHRILQPRLPKAKAILCVPGNGNSIYCRNTHKHHSDTFRHLAHIYDQLICSNLLKKKTQSKIKIENSAHLGKLSREQAPPSPRLVATRKNVTMEITVQEPMFPSKRYW